MPARRRLSARPDPKYATSAPTPRSRGAHVRCEAFDHRWARKQAKRYRQFARTIHDEEVAELAKSMASELDETAGEVEELIEAVDREIAISALQKSPAGPPTIH